MARQAISAIPPFPLYSGEAAQTGVSPVEDAVLPARSFPSAPEADSGRGERALMRAVLEDALSCFQTYRQATRPSLQRLAREAEAWIWAEDLRWPFSFINICLALDLDPDYVRRGVKRWRQRGPARRRRLRRSTSPRYDRPLAA